MKKLKKFELTLDLGNKAINQAIFLASSRKPPSSMAGQAPAPSSTLLSPPVN